MNEERRIRMFIMAAADSLSELRGCDVWRVMESADRAGLASKTSQYILKDRPDLEPNIHAYFLETCPF